MNTLNLHHVYSTEDTFLHNYEANALESHEILKICLFVTDDKVWIMVKINVWNLS